MKREQIQAKRPPPQRQHGRGKKLPVRMSVRPPVRRPRPRYQQLTSMLSPDAADATVVNRAAEEAAEDGCGVCTTVAHLTSV